MREIKFRGIDQITGKYVYGDYNSFFETPLIEVDLGGVAIEPESLSQLVGRDKKGREVYEGDKIKNPVDGTTFKAGMNHIYAVKSYLLEATT